MTACPSCGRPVEGGETCLHCGASLTLRLPLRLFRYGALAVAVGGLFALFFGARGAEVPRLPIGGLGAAQNLAYVEIAGLVSEPVRYNPQSQSLLFRVDDGTGDLLVSVFRAEAEALIAAGRVPAVGDRVTVQGSLRVREDFIGLTLNLPQALQVERSAPTPLTIGAIHAGLALQPVEVTARIVSTREPYSGLTLIELQDATGLIEASLDESTRALTGDPAGFAPNDVVRLSGVVTLFRETPQITLTSSRAISVLPAGTPLALESAEPVSVIPIAEVRAGAAATVEGLVTGAASYAGGFEFTLDDGTGALTLLLRESVYRDVAGREGLRPGARVRASGSTEIFDGALEIMPAEAGAVTVVAPGASAEAAVPMDSITLTSVGQTATVAGQITAVADFDQGIRFTLDDDTGAISVLLWDNVLAFAPDRDQLTAGQSVRVTGLIDEYHGALEIVPQIGFDVSIQ